MVCKQKCKWTDESCEEGEDGALYMTCEYCGARGPEITVDSAGEGAFEDEIAPEHADGPRNGDLMD